MAQNFQRKPGRVAVWAGIWLYPYIRIYDSGESTLSLQNKSDKQQRPYKRMAKKRRATRPSVLLLFRTARSTAKPARLVHTARERSTLQYAGHTLTATFVNAHAEDVLGTSRCWCVWWRHWFTIVEVTTGRVAPAPKAMFAVTSSFTTSMWPFRAATYTGVDPSACSFSAVMYTRVNPASAVACCFYQKFSTLPQQQLAFHGPRRTNKQTNDNTISNAFNIQRNLTLNFCFTYCIKSVYLFCIESTALPRREIAQVLRTKCHSMEATHLK